MTSYLGGSVYNDSQVTKEWVEEQIEKNGPGVFWVTYNVTTLQELQDARDAGKIPVIKYTAQNGNVIYAPINIKGVSGYYTFSSGLSENNDYFVFRLSSTGVWSYSQCTAESVFYCQYGTTTYSLAKDAYDAGKLLVVKDVISGKNVYYTLVNFDSANSRFTFSALDVSADGKKITFTLTDGSGWDLTQTNLYDNALNASSVNAVQNATLYSVIGDVETLLAAL